MGKENALIENLRRFKKKVATVLPIQKMLFFGSMAEGRGKKWSDVDLIIVSKCFRGKRPLDRGRELYLKWNIDSPVDFLCYTPAEFEKAKKRIGLVSYALRHGIMV